MENWPEENASKLYHVDVMAKNEISSQSELYARKRRGEKPASLCAERIMVPSDLSIFG